MSLAWFPVYLTNFGLKDEERARIFHASADLFDMDESDEVSLLKRIKPEDNMGYAPFRSETLNRSRPAELKEAFNIRFPPAHDNDLNGCPGSFVNSSRVVLSIMREAAFRYSFSLRVGSGSSD